MSGCPAGMEFDSDDDFDDFDSGYKEKRFEEPTLASLVPSTTTTTTTGKSSIFNPASNPQNMEELDQCVSLSCEDMKLAISREDLTHARRALQQGFGSDTLLVSGWTGLMYACDIASHQAVALLLEHGANVNFQKDLFTPLMTVCNSSVRHEDNLVSCARLLIEAGARVNVHDRHVMTPLMYAAKLGYAKLVSLLCESKADLDVQDTQGWSAMTFACERGSSHVVRVLLKHKADHNITAYDGQRPADVAFAHGHSSLADMLEKYDGSNMEQFPSQPSDGSKNSQQSGKYVSYGDLELFLYGLELGDLIPLLQQHKLEFKDLLKLTEDEMIEVGITQLGVRKKLLESIRQVHTTEWDTSALTRDQMSKLTTLEMSAVVANVAKHLQIIDCSVKYINKHLHAKKNDLISDNIALQKSLLDQCAEALRCTTSLHVDIQALQKDASVMFPNIDRTPADLIQTVGGGGRRREKYLRLCGSVGIVVVLTGGVFVVVKRLLVGR